MVNGHDFLTPSKTYLELIWDGQPDKAEQYNNEHGRPLSNAFIARDPEVYDFLEALPIEKLSVILPLVEYALEYLEAEQDICYKGWDNYDPTEYGKYGRLVQIYKTICIGNGLEIRLVE